MGERRTCEICGEQFSMVFTDGCLCVCEEHFEEFMGKEFGIWRQNDHEDCRNWDGGFYDYYSPSQGEWFDTGIYWTEY